MKKILYCVYGVFFTFIVWHVMFAIDGFDGAVKNSYKKGMDYPRQMAKKQELGLMFVGSPKQIVVGQPVDLVLDITEHAKIPVTGAEVTMEVARPASMQSAAPTTPTTEETAGKYHMHLMVPEYGHWTVTAKITIGDEEFTHEFRLYAEREKTNET
jgi:FixH